MISEDQIIGEAKRRGVTPRNAIFAKVSAKRNKILETLFSLLDSKNENVQLGAAKTLINKLLPDLKAHEFEEEKELEGPIIYKPYKD